MAKPKKTSVPRRRFLQALAAVPVAVGLETASAETDETPLEARATLGRVPMLQSWTDAESALVVVLGGPAWKFKASTKNPSLRIQLLQADSLEGSGYVLYRLRISGLSLTRYQSWHVLNAQNSVIDTRSLKGLDLDLSKPKVAVVSCSNYRNLKAQGAMYQQMAQQNPDLILCIGDMVYANSSLSTIFGTPENPATALGRYIETWSKVNLYRMEPLIPSLAVWDDHDYGTNNGNSGHPYKEEMLRIFRRFYALPEAHERLHLGPGVAFRLRAFGVDIHMLDGRSGLVEGDTQWGRSQEAWFVKDFKASQNPAWILNGTQFFRYVLIGECVEKSGPTTLKLLKGLFRTHKKPTALFSGDVHASQVQEIAENIFGFKTYEITSSAIHSSSAGFTLKRSAGDGQLFYYGKPNFILVESHITGRAMDLTLSCATEAGTYPIANRPFRIAV